MKNRFFIGFLTLPFLSNMATANSTCSNLYEKFDSRNLSGPMYCSNIKKTDANFNFASIAYDTSDKYRISLWNLEKSNKTPVYSSAFFRMPFKGCCSIEIKNNSVYLSGDSSSSSDVLDETYQIKFRNDIFQVIGYQGCENIFDNKHNDNQAKTKTCADINLITGNYKRSIKNGRKKPTETKGRIKISIFDANKNDFLDAPQDIGGRVINSSLNF